MPAHEASSRQRGFTLIEALVAILIFSVALLGTASMLFTALSASTGANSRYIAGCVAQGYADDIMKRTYANISSHGTPISDKVNGRSFSTVWTVNIVTITSSTSRTATAKSFAVATSWTDKTGSHSVTLTGLRAQ